MKKQSSKGINVFAHDYFNNLGGGENLALTFLKYNKSFYLLTFFITNFLKKKIFNKKTILIGNYKNKLSLLYNLFFFQIKKKVNYYIASGNYTPLLNIYNCEKKVFYCHSLPKFFFLYNKFYSKKKIFLYILYLIISPIFKKIYIKKINKFDIIIANSNYTKNQLKKITSKKIYIIYPPIKIIKKKIRYNNFFIFNNRHEKEKNLDIAIKCFQTNKKYKLIITSKGSLTKKLKEKCMNDKNIIFLGLVSRKKYEDLLSKCLGTLNISKHEDFGMSAIETMAIGKPCIVLNQGGYLETVTNNKNGFILDKNNIENSLNKFLNNIKITDIKKMKKNCFNQAKLFSEKNFLKNMKKILL